MNTKYTHLPLILLGRLLSFQKFTWLLNIMVIIKKKS